MSLKEIISRTSMANIVAGILIIVAGAYAFYTKDTKLMTFLAGVSVGYLFKRAS